MLSHSDNNQTDIIEAPDIQMTCLRLIIIILNKW